MRRVLILVAAAILVLAVVPGWSGEERLPLLGRTPQMAATPVGFDADDPRRRRAGALEFLGGVALTSRDPAFGGFSSLLVAGDRFTLLSDGGNIVSFAMGGDWKPHALAFANLPAGPGIGWQKSDRDSESMTLDPASGRIWVGFENHNAIWRYAPAFAHAEREVAPMAMQNWPVNGGPETLVRLHDGRFLTISETGHVPHRFWHGSEALRLHTREALLFPGDPTVTGAPPARFALLLDRGYDPSDATVLPGGDLLVLTRAFALPFRFSTQIARIRAADIRAGSIVRGDVLATLDAPLIHDNFEGITTTREGDATIVWLVSDDNQLILQRSLLLKFRLHRR